MRERQGERVSRNFVLSMQLDDEDDDDKKEDIYIYIYIYIERERENLSLLPIDVITRLPMRATYSMSPHLIILAVF